MAPLRETPRGGRRPKTLARVIQVETHRGVNLVADVPSIPPNAADRRPRAASQRLRLRTSGLAWNNRDVLLGERFSWCGREVAWTEFGSGPTVVFCHGTPWSSVLWAPFARALSKDFRVFLWDMPGYGQSSKNAEHDVDLGVQAELLADLLDHWGLQDPHIVAHDYGGAVSLRAHLLHRRSYASLCLVDVVALRPWGSAFFTLVRENADVFSALPAAVHVGAVRAYIETASHRGLRSDDLATLVDPWLGEDGQAAFYRQIAQADERFTDDVETRLGELLLPTHIVWGKEDSWIPADRAARLQQLIPDSTLTVVDDASHLIHFDAPAALANELRAWLSTRTG